MCLQLKFDFHKPWLSLVKCVIHLSAQESTGSHWKQIARDGVCTCVCLYWISGLLKTHRILPILLTGHLDSTLRHSKSIWHLCIETLPVMHHYRIIGLQSQNRYMDGSCRYCIESLWLTSWWDDMLQCYLI